MHSLLHHHLAHATAAERARAGGERVAREQPPPGRLRVRTAAALVALAGRLDREQARRALA